MSTTASYKSIQDRIMQVLGLSGKGMRDLVKVWINEVGRDFHNRHNWSYRRKEAFFQTKGQYTTGTVAVTQDSATVTLTGGTLIADHANARFALGLSNPWYEISSVSDPTITLERAYVGGTDASATYTLFYDEYSLASDVQALISGQVYLHDSSDRQIGSLRAREMYDRRPLPQSDGRPRYFFLAPEENGVIRMRLWPVPDDQYLVRYYYDAQYEDMKSDGATPVIPQRWRDVLIWGTLAKCALELPQFSDTNLGVKYEGMFEKKLMEAWGEERESPSVFHTKGWDEGGNVNTFPFETPVT